MKSDNCNQSIEKGHNWWQHKSAFLGLQGANTIKRYCRYYSNFVATSSKRCFQRQNIFLKIVTPDMTSFNILALAFQVISALLSTQSVSFPSGHFELSGGRRTGHSVGRGPTGRVLNPWLFVSVFLLAIECKGCKGVVLAMVGIFRVQYLPM